MSLISENAVHKGWYGYKLTARISIEKVNSEQKSSQLKSRMNFNEITHDRNSTQPPILSHCCEMFLSLISIRDFHWPHQ